MRLSRSDGILICERFWVGVPVGQISFLPPLLHLVAQFGSVLGQRTVKGLQCRLRAWFESDLGTNLINTPGRRQSGTTATI